MGHFCPFFGPEDQGPEGGFWGPQERATQGSQGPPGPAQPWWLRGLEPGSYGAETDRAPQEIDNS